MYLNFEQVSSVKIKVQVISLIRLICLGKINVQNLESLAIRWQSCIQNL